MREPPCLTVRLDRDGAGHGCGSREPQIRRRRVGCRGTPPHDSSSCVPVVQGGHLAAPQHCRDVNVSDD